MPPDSPVQEHVVSQQGSGSTLKAAEAPVVAVSPARQRSRFYRAELDILRFTAFLLVFITHYPHYPDQPVLAALLGLGRDGLLLFFVLSAYLITGLLLRERETTGKIHVPAFFLRRVLRIWPLYFLAIGLAFCCKGIFLNIPLSPRALPYLC